MKKIFFIPILILISLCILPDQGDAATSETFSLTILHTNDSHSYVEMYPYLTTAIKQEKVKSPNALLLDSGDVFYAPSPYFTEYKGQASVWFMNNLSYDAMTFGNHEFNKSADILGNFIKGLNFPILSSNLDVTNNPILGPLYNNQISFNPQGGSIYPAIIKNIDGQQVGIFGLTISLNSSQLGPTPITDISLQDYTTKAKGTVEALQQLGVNKIIVLSHLGYTEDMQLANEVSGIDVIVGGHSHTELSVPVLIDKLEPTVIVQAGSYLNYLGRLNVTFDNNGVVTANTGKLLDLRSYTQDPEAIAKVNEYKNNITPTQPMNKNGWVVEEGNTYYYLNGEMQTGWQTIEGKQYYFGSYTGIMKTGWYTISDLLYYFGTDGSLFTDGWMTDGNYTYYFVNAEMRTGWQTIEGNQYYFGSTTGIMKTGLYMISGVTYNFGTDGVLIPDPVKEGWMVEGGETYYYVNGEKQTGWQTIEGKQYYFGSTTGIMKTGLYTISGVTYNFGKDGVLVPDPVKEGWIVDGGNTYYYIDDEMQTGWQTIEGKQYYFGSTTGIMKTGLYTISGVTYNFGTDGVLIPDPIKEGWIVEEGNTYYYVSGAMQTGWQTINGKQYYFGSITGIMKTGWYTISDILYYFGTDGVLVPDPVKEGWIVDGGNTYYFINGEMQTGWQTIDGKQYYFGSTTGIMKTGLYTISGVTYNFGTDGVLIQ